MVQLPCVQKCTKFWKLTAVPQLISSATCHSQVTEHLSHPPHWPGSPEDLKSRPEVSRLDSSKAHSRSLNRRWQGYGFLTPNARS